VTERAYGCKSLLWLSAKKNSLLEDLRQTWFNARKKRNSQMVIVLFFMNGNKQKCVVVSSCTELPDGLPRDAGKPGIVPG